MENIEVHFKRKPAEILEEDNKVKGLVLENREKEGNSIYYK